MITVSQLTAFDPASWNNAAGWARDRGKESTEAQAELETQAAKLAAAWPSWVGQLAVAAIRNQAAAQGELATAYSDGATVIDDCSIGIVALRDQMKDLQSTVAGTADLAGPDDVGVVTSTKGFSLTEIIDWLRLRAQAGSSPSPRARSSCRPPTRTAARRSS